MASDAATYSSYRLSDYFTDYVSAHLEAGLAIRAGDGTVILAPLDGRKDNELMVLSSGDEVDLDEFSSALHTVYATYTKRLGIYCWSSAFAMKPLDEQGNYIFKVG